MEPCSPASVLNTKLEEVMDNCFRLWRSMVFINSILQTRPDIISRPMSRQNAVSDITSLPNSSVSDQTKSTTNQLPSRRAELGTTVPRKKVMEILQKIRAEKEMRHRELAVDASPGPSESDLSAEEEANEAVDGWSIGSDLQSSLEDDSPIEISSEEEEQTQHSSSVIITPTGGRRVYSERQKISQATGPNATLSSIGDPPESASLGKSEKNVKPMESLFGLLPPVPSEFGTMATTVTVRRCSTTSLVTCHSATCSTSLKATKCSCKSKADIAPGDLQWCSLQAIDTGNNGNSPKGKTMVSVPCHQKKRPSSDAGSKSVKKSKARPYRSLKP